jgi:hypothetical protein
VALLLALIGGGDCGVAQCLRRRRLWLPRLLPPRQREPDGD